MKWMTVENFEGLYEVSENGDIKSIPRNGTLGGLLKQAVDRYGYKKVVLYKNNKPHYFTVHRLVASAFVPTVDGKNQVNHIDGNKLNNHYTNLEWVTNIENLDHSFEKGLQRIPKQPIIAVDLGTGQTFQFQSQKEAARKMNLHQWNISKALNDGSAYKGFKFERMG